MRPHSSQTTRGAEARSSRPTDTSVTSIHRASGCRWSRTAADMLWYAFKVVADPQSGKAEIFVNGKLDLARLRISRRPSSPFKRPIRHVRRGAVWIDDVRVYPWQDYPADYVPAAAARGSQGRPSARRAELLLVERRGRLRRLGLRVSLRRAAKAVLGLVRRGQPGGGRLGNQVAGRARHRLRTVLLVPAERRDQPSDQGRRSGTGDPRRAVQCPLQRI